MAADGKLTLSALPKTWILDLDGTLVMHNGHLTECGDELAPGARELLCQIAPEDMVIIVTSRSDDYREQTEAFLAENGVSYDHIVWNAPVGERILVNDRKPSGLTTAYAVNCERDCLAGIKVSIDADL